MADTYTLLEQLPDGPATVNASAQTYWVNVYKTALTVTVALAFVMIIVGGVQYTTAFASPSAKSEASGRIWAAIGGLLLALFSYLILRTINPEFVNPCILQGTC